MLQFRHAESLLFDEPVHPLASSKKREQSLPLEYTRGSARQKWEQTLAAKDDVPRRFEFRVEARAEYLPRIRAQWVQDIQVVGR